MSRFSTTAKLVEPAHQQIFAKQKSAGLRTWILAVSTALAVLGTAPFAQAAIVKGTISGTWDYSAQGGFNLNDHFTADYEYEYDDIAISPFNNSGTDYSNTEFNVVLNSLRVISGSYDHTFDFLTPGAGSGSFSFLNRTRTAPTYTSSTERLVQVVASDTIGNYFLAIRHVGQDNGIPFLSGYAGVRTSDFGSSGFEALASPNVVNFSPDPTAVTAVPTPALLPGLAAFGLGVWRKRKQAKHVEM